MKSSYVLAALVGFALLNTAFLGAYLYSSTSVFGGLNTPVSQLQTQVSDSTVAGGSALSTTSNVLTTSTGTVASSATSPGQSATSSALSNSESSVPAYGTGVTSGTTSGSPAAPSGLLVMSVVQFFESHSLALAPTSWVAVGGMWIWRGRMRSKWTDLGFDSDVFSLFVKMKGGKTRIRLLDALSLPKDRLQLAQELGLDWKGVDRHLVIMKKYGFVDDRVAYGKVRMYQLTPMGASLLRLLQELSREEKRDGVVDRQASQGPVFLN